MPEWLIEHGIGETRAVVIEQGEIVQARIHLPDIVRAGTGRQAVLKTAGKPAIATDGAQEYLLPKGAGSATEGEAILIEVTREAIPGTEPWKRPLARVTDHIATPLLEGEPIAFPAPNDSLEQAGWSDVLEEASSGIIRFEGGELRVSCTPAMTLIDVDGCLPPSDLAKVAAAEAARTILRHGIGGSIGVDFPTVAGKAERQAIAETIDALLPKPFERTAVNGFGFLQIVRPRNHASLFELAADRAAFETRALLRRIAFEPPGPKRLVAHPAVVTLLDRKPEWMAQLSQQVGGQIALRPDAALPMSGGYGEVIPS